MRKFGFATHARQTYAIAGTSFGMIAKSAAGIVALPVAALLMLLMPALAGLKGVPLLPATGHILSVLTAPVADNPRLAWMLIPLLIVYYAGEVVWQERDAGLSEIADAAPVPEWVVFLGKFLGLSLVLFVWMALVTAAGVVGQMRMGYFDFEFGLYLRILGLQLIDYLLFALLVFVVHAVANQKQVGYLVALIVYGVIAFPSTFGLEHHLLIYGSGPKWSYSDIRGFGPSLAPWLWFRLYWALWAPLLAVAGTLLWPRGSQSPGARLRLALRRSTPVTAGVAAAALTLILTVGGFIFYNTNVLNSYVTAADRMTRSAEYERRYGKYRDVPQPTLTGTNLRVEIYPDRLEADVRGTYALANNTSVAIGSIHLTTVPEIRTGAASIDRPATLVLADDDVGYRVYALKAPLQPGDSLHLSFEVHVAPHGFHNNGADAFVAANGSHFTNRDWLPAVGYQRNREIDAAGVRKQMRVGGGPIAFEAIIGTSADQVAVAPGVLHRAWTEGGRRYFHYVTDVPVNNEYGLFSARYAMREERWSAESQSIAIQVFHHPTHVANLDRMLKSVRASLDFYTRNLGPYPYSYIRLIESSGPGMGVYTEAATIEYGEGFSLLNPGSGPQDRDVVFAVVAHAVARGWWGMQVVPADAAGAGLLDVSLETYSGMRVVEETLGPDALHRYLQSMREESSGPRNRARPPLLRATDSFSFARKGPSALYAMREYIGKERVDDALRSLLGKYGSGASPLATSLDFYHELQAVTPDTYQYLVRDLFEKNTLWELATERATARHTSANVWQVTLDVRARKAVVDEVGIETEAPMDDWVEVGVFGEGEPFREKHRIRSGRQTITVPLPRKPARAGIDPENLLMDVDPEDNMKDVKIGETP